MEPTHVSFMGVFHCSWMADTSSSSSASALVVANPVYYLTKSYKGSTVSRCLDWSELTTNRCYSHFALKYPYYGTGHVVYKGHMFYNQLGTSYLVSYNLATGVSTRVHAPDDALCCDVTRHGLYHIKHTGFFDFEVDENGLWLIYRQQQQQQQQPISAPDGTVVFVVAKIDERDLAEMRVARKWTLVNGGGGGQQQQQPIVNMFIACGQVYALRQTAESRALVQKVCDLNGSSDEGECAATSSSVGGFNVSISTRQLTALSYSPNRRWMSMVDGGNVVYHAMTLA